MSAGERQFRLGELMIREGLLTMDGVQKVLAIQKQQEEARGGKHTLFGQICIDLGMIDSPELQRLLKKYNKRIYLGELLVSMGLIQPEHIDMILARQKTSPLRFGELLLAHDLITEAQLLDALCLQLDILRIIPTPAMLDAKLMDGMEVFVRNHQVLPLHGYGDSITVVMVNPDDKAMIRDLQRILGSRVKPAMATAAEITEAIQAYYKGETAASKFYREGFEF